MTPSEAFGEGYVINFPVSALLCRVESPGFMSGRVVKNYFLPHDVDFGQFRSYVATTFLILPLEGGP